ncbi:hypothetical protein MSG28_011590 [Choristoneura fumiferana]|uniref:Uncharacterized protein n=1 Tax=Choristoneura fumiferana TaxID=7141 RepID=A0ACC0JP18_CHOFU|nr:hypothetical protein MSG28_011590 [Choristoneura fumiferana]
MDDDEDEQKSKKKAKDEDEPKKNKDDEQAVLLNEPCPGACTVRKNPCCVVRDKDPVAPLECFVPFDYCSVEMDIPPPPPKKECPTREDKKKCPGRKDK